MQERALLVASGEIGLTMPLLPQVGVQLATVLRETEESCTGDCVRNWKIGFAAILVVEGIIFAHVIFLLRRFSSKSPQTIHTATLYGHALSAGVFLATGFLHILPEAIELIDGTHDESAHEGEEEGHSDRAVHSIRALSKLAGAVTSREEGDEEGHEEGHDEHSEEEAKFPWAFAIMLASFYALFLLEKIFVPVLMRRKPATGVAAEMDSDKGAMTDGATRAHDEHGDHEHGHVHGVVEPEHFNLDVTSENRPGVASMAFVVAMTQVVGISAHSLFESVALGLSTTMTSSGHIFAATAAHRWATALGISLFFAGRLSYFAFAIAVFFFSAVVPIGVGIGFGVSSLSQTARGVLFAMSAGTFLYVGVVEGMGAAFGSKSESRKGLLFLTMLFGSAVIVAITAILVATGVAH